MRLRSAVAFSCLAGAIGLLSLKTGRAQNAKQSSQSSFLGSPETNSRQLITQGRQIFRFDTFGDEVFWTGQLQMQQVVSNFTPRNALGLGLKVDSQALTSLQINAIRQGKLNLDDPAVRLQLIKQNAVLGVAGTFSNNTLSSVGFTCAICHSTVDNSVVLGIGSRIDGLANRDLNVGAIIASAPNLQPVVDLLRLAPADANITADDVRAVLKSWGPGKFDAELFLDGKAFNPQQVTNGVVTGTNVPGATLLPNARGLSGHNLHTWTGGWGTVTYWNALVAYLELHGVGTFFDGRLDNAAQFPIAAAAHFGHVSTDDPDKDMITRKLAPLHFYQLALPARCSRALGLISIRLQRSAETGLFSGKANCSSCHREPLWTEPGWNQHTADEMKIDSFEADRSPGHAYRTMNLAGIFVRENGLFMLSKTKGASTTMADSRRCSIRLTATTRDSIWD